MTLGILGGGQLGYMLALAGYPLGLHFRFLDPSPEAPVGRIAQRVTADYSDHAALEKSANGLELVTYEFENVPVEAAKFLTQRVPVYPPPAALEAAQDRLAEKTLFRNLGISTTEFLPVSELGDFEAAVKKLGLPAVLKTSRMGYDGKGQWILRTAEDVAKAKSELPKVAHILERFVSFTRELSVLAVRSRTGETAFYPLVENLHRGGVLRLSLAPAPSLAPAVQRAAEDIARRVLESLK
ncbi:MAG TPA: ATP-grasp domain-containing protein, partial [Candidatus Dormibacteraeota bacterium]|nr:ATP-grasp domain-containing protein [Candidatus Dormibacteraeota bacterium]